MKIHLRKILLVMKLIFCFICCFLFSLHASIRAQKQMVTLKLEKTSVAEAIRELKQQTRLDLFISNKVNKSSKSNNSLLRTGIVVGIGLALHNFPEGLAIGSGFGTSVTLGISLAIAICLHDVPEGIFQSRQWWKYA